jgi:hypothetical protein
MFGLTSLDPLECGKEALLDDGRRVEVSCRELGNEPSMTGEAPAQRSRAAKLTTQAGPNMANVSLAIYLDDDFFQPASHAV